MENGEETPKGATLKNLEKMKHLTMLAEHRAHLEFIKEEYADENLKELDKILEHIETLISMAIDCTGENADPIRKMFADFDETLELFTEKFAY